MGHKPDREVVARRLAALAAMFTAETVDEGRARLRSEAMAPDALATAVSRRLDELRALDELTRYLHGRTSVRPTSGT
jgi:hypothetical protein